MDEMRDEKTPRRKPGAPFFLVAMTFYLLVVHGSSLLGAGAVGLAVPAQQYPGVWPELNRVLNILGETAFSSALWGMILLYACMVCLFFLTRRLVPGPPWMGSLAGSFVMAHPVTTEVLFTPTGLYYGLATLLALGATLCYVCHRDTGGLGSYAATLILFSLAVIPFSINGALFIVILIMTWCVGDSDARRWIKLMPLAAVTLLAGWFPIEARYGDLAPVSDMYGPLLLILYPIGLLPDTVAELSVHPEVGWFWGAVAAMSVVLLLWKVPSAAFRGALLAVVGFRFFPGSMEIDLTTLDGGGQLFLPLTLVGLGIAALSAWLMRFEAWGQPVVALTTILCAVLFVLQFQGNRAYIQRLDSGDVTFRSRLGRPSENARTPARATGMSAPMEKNVNTRHAQRGEVRSSWPG